MSTSYQTPEIAGYLDLATFEVRDDAPVLSREATAILAEARAAARRVVAAASVVAAATLAEGCVSERELVATLERRRRADDLEREAGTYEAWAEEERRRAVERPAMVDEATRLAAKHAKAASSCRRRAEDLRAARYQTTPDGRRVLVTAPRDAR